MEPQRLCPRCRLRRSNMIREKGMDIPGNSHCGPAKTRRTLHPLVTLCLPPGTAANGQKPSSGEGEAAGRDAPITVWWDYPPS